jgi:CrcB protein
VTRGPRDATAMDIDDDPRADLPVDPDVTIDTGSAAPSSIFDYRPRRRRHLDIIAVIAFGGGLGSVSRYLVGEAVPTHPGHFPWATFLINISGGFALGFLMVLILDVWPPTRYVRPFFCIGILGGFTTFSTMTAEIRALAADGRLAITDSYALDSLVTGLVAVWVGIALARLTTGRPVRHGARNQGGTTR